MNLPDSEKLWKENFDKISCFSDDTSKRTKLATKLKKYTKNLYDFGKNEFNTSKNALPELIIDGFDEEQIWQQIELQNEEDLSGNHVHDVTVEFLKSKQYKINSSQSDDVDDGYDDHDGDDLEDETFDEDMEKAEEVNEDIKDDDDMSDSDDDIDIDIKGNLKNKKTPPKKSFKPSVVDDNFFKLEHMHEFLEKEEKKENNENEHESDESDGENIDLFQDNSDDEEDPDNPKLHYYSDFFDNPDGNADGEHDSPETMNDEVNESKENSEADEDIDSKMSRKRKHEDSLTNDKRVKFDGVEDSEDNKSSHELEDENNPKTMLGKCGERLAKTLQNFENKTISEKHWRKKGEIVAASRPIDSIFENILEFNLGIRPAEPVTEETTQKLEDIIKRRIIDKAWDDVEKKFKPVVTPLEYKKKLVMDQEKSQKSLAQIYEESYLKQREALDPTAEDKEVEEPKEHIEIRKRMNDLFAKLDALSNFHYTPRPAQPEIKIVSNIPAVNVEEVGPLAMSEASLLAPEEVKKKLHGDLIGTSERTKTDKKRERRKKKIQQREKNKANDKKEDDLAGNLKANSKKQSRKVLSAMVKKLTKNKNISLLNEKNSNGKRKK